ncbi:dihydroorotate dehydrogenase [Cytobacillus eiseniae]|uniref:Dihydroorotate dehydrogenase n=1 Tax=Cytobacillus eiseniae TaxID=762947 RepID=A0ABS4RDA3_9BACI|nr:hypothetical protein [Cytobacillus eiseniae]MBP2240880.1 dihydroorotate dehydrogenase [Cytobacillus eiseniae]
MPDWSYHPLKKLLLDKISPKASREFIHKSMSTIASIPGGRNLIGFLGHMKAPHEFQKDIHHIHYPSPIGLNGHIDPHLSGMNVFQELGFGFVEIGPIVLTEPEEQLEPRRKGNHIQFSEQLEKVPLRSALKKLIKHTIRIPVFARIDEQVNKEEWAIIVQHLSPFVDAFIGTSEQLTSCIDQKAFAFDRFFYVSFSTDEFDNNTIDLGKLLKNQYVAGVVLNAPHQSNGSYWHEIVNANESLIKMVTQFKEQYPELIILTSGGVETPNEAYALVHAGADLVMLTDGYVNAGPGLPKRIHERILYEEVHPMKEHSWHWSFLFGLSILFGGIIALYFAFTDVILPYDESFIGLSRADILQINPLILSFMSHDRMALAGTMISGGILYTQLARHGIKYGLHWTKIAFHSAAIIGFLGIFLFIGFGYFDWLHGIFWVILLPIYYFSFQEGKNAITPPYSVHGENDHLWKYGLYGQLCFILLGFLLLLGGLVISTIGVSKVFVSTDLNFLCMSPEILETVSANLIPVIAHDRAGFGSALISVGLLVLTLSLWGFRKGERWVWNTLCLGALPAFIAGIGTHLYIGYTTFIHLLPVYFLVLIYLLGLILSYPYLKKK